MIEFEIIELTQSDLILCIVANIIVASALENGCSILYSEDMQHELNIENQLTIKNPFIS